MKTTIQISDELWKKLNSMKKLRGETFEDIIWKYLKRDDSFNKTSDSTNSFFSSDSNGAVSKSRRKSK